MIRYCYHKIEIIRVFEALGVPRSLVSRQSAHEVGKVVSPPHWPPLPPGNIPGTHIS